MIKDEKIKESVKDYQDSRSAPSRPLYKSPEYVCNSRKISKALCAKVNTRESWEESGSRNKDSSHKTTRFYNCL